MRRRDNLGGSSTHSNKMCVSVTVFFMLTFHTMSITAITPSNSADHVTYTQLRPVSEIRILLCTAPFENIHAYAQVEVCHASNKIAIDRHFFFFLHTSHLGASLVNFWSS